MEELILDQKDAADWVYRGEGAANLVLAYTGSYPVFIGKVMRIQKAPTNGKQGVNGNGEFTAHELLLWGEIKELMSSSSTREIVEQLYVKHVISPLLGPNHVDAGMRILVTKEFLESVERNVICERPAWRVDAAQIDMHRDFVLLISDHSLFLNDTLKGGMCISVEIKPKCGFLPLSRFIAEANAIKRSVTRFEMHQALKLHQEEISELSKYDPLDLFSNSRDRIHRAIKALYATPQNNFRVFLNGSLLFGGLGGGTESTSFVTSEAFEDALKPVIKAENGMRTMSFIQLVADAFYASGVLDRLLEVQKLDSLDIEGAIHAYYNVISQPCMVCRELNENKVSNCFTSLHSIPLDESLKIVKDFLIAATAKDCSLMVSFRPREGKDAGSSYDNIHLESTKQAFDYKVYFIDLDLKPLKKMEDYYELDKKIVSCYSQMLQTEHGVDKASRRNSHGTILR
ncbi:hypothetical protein SLEP1_g53893 [Rubroshorea leprosula]|uniref:Inositol-pentakisphosphate 2-kinase n=1 Tax=Rubroshorea leprosula TaxID=152421 RepID=A0AAV5MBL4_9ROSI|nr:hypothetical protein SLEP1_g53893 [Rubroshorea leprosula]